MKLINPFAFIFILATVLLFNSEASFAAKKQKRKVKVYDKISYITHALMTKSTAKGNVVTFEWDEPHWDFKYFLEIYRKGNPRPIRIMPVKGSSKKLKFPKKDNLYWRVVAVSKHGHKTKNKKLLKVPI